MPQTRRPLPNELITWRQTNTGAALETIAGIHMHVSVNGLKSEYNAQ